MSLVTPLLVCKRSLALRLSAGDSSGFWGELTSASVVVSIVGDSFSGLQGESGVRVACWWLLFRVLREVGLSFCGSWHSWWLHLHVVKVRVPWWLSLPWNECLHSFLARGTNATCMGMSACTPWLGGLTLPTSEWAPALYSPISFNH